MMRVRRDAADLYAGRSWLVLGVRFLLWCCTALWVPVLLLPGDTTDRADTYDTVRWVAAWLHLPSLGPWVSPAELLILVTAGGLALFSAYDYLRGGSRFAPARVYLSGIFWFGLWVAYVIANPIGYGTWLFGGITYLHWWCLTRVRA